MWDGPTMPALNDPVLIILLARRPRRSPRAQRISFRDRDGLHIAPCGSDDQMLDRSASLVKRFGEARRPAFGAVPSTTRWGSCTQNMSSYSLSCFSFLALPPSLKTPLSYVGVSARCTLRPPGGQNLTVSSTHRTTAAPSASPTSNMKSSNELDFNIVSSTCTCARTTLLT